MDFKKEKLVCTRIVFAYIATKQQQSKVVTWKGMFGAVDLDGELGEEDMIHISWKSDDDSWYLYLIPSDEKEIVKKIGGDEEAIQLIERLSFASDMRRVFYSEPKTVTALKRKFQNNGIHTQLA